MRGVHDPRHEGTWRYRAPERVGLTLFVWVAVARGVWIPTTLLMGIDTGADGRRVLVGVAVSLAVAAVLTLLSMRFYFRRRKRRHWLIGAARAYRVRQDDRR
ncbi:hypothetical protein G3I32_04840 [Streptomyces coelicoflavus]|uniref:Uncharacterized protein n=1 Tax=Streptomyces coelicoflavus TaxID=285562 RepID=A0A7K3PDW1_9ACTN|nr:hypothetical protein [Streptomyces coelicoflavus]NEB08204.1 hypothetical protein [Streptomyces coelicoflavus]